MPTYRGIAIELRSQFDIEVLPEYSPRPQAYYHGRGIAAKAPLFVDKQTSTCSTYVPVYPGSQFWIGYAVLPPVPDEAYFLFKLFINGAHIVSWSCGKQDAWKGKAMFGLFEKEDEDGRKRVEKRCLFFTPPDRKDGEWKEVTNAFDPDAYIEIRVHRAHARTRIGRKFDDYATTPHGHDGRGVDLVNAGLAGGGHPKRFYKFALIDPVDQPYASFRYLYRTWAQLEYLGMLDDESDASVLSSPGKAGPGSERRARGGGGTGLGGSEGEDVFASVSLSDDDVESPSQSARPNYRLSVPPSLKLSPPKHSSKPLPLIPQKNDPLTSLSYQPHPAYPVDEWVARTPSPVKSMRDGISTPPLGKKRGTVATSFLSAVASAWKRRGTPSLELSDDGGSRSASSASRA